tara:strand:+ start:9975 stop:10382 length:408 start_codon:yes stop_codon:yes gene_type:complete
MSNEEVKQKVLVAEDSAPNRNILCHLLKKLNFEVVEAENGAIAMEKLEQNTDCVLIISDIMMPEKNGLDFLEFVRAHDKCKDVPFVLVTAVAEKDYIMRAKESSVQGYLLKPISFDKLTAKLKEVFPDQKFSVAS